MMLNAANPKPKCNLAAYQARKSIQHFILAANLGGGTSIQKIKRRLYADGLVSKEDFGVALFVLIRSP